MILIPVHSFLCENCGESFELIRKISEDSIPDCPNCNSSEKIVRTVGKTTFKLKGGGWADSGYSK